MYIEQNFAKLVELLLNYHSSVFAINDDNIDIKVYKYFELCAHLYGNFLYQKYSQRISKTFHSGHRAIFLTYFNSSASQKLQFIDQSINYPLNLSNNGHFAYPCFPKSNDSLVIAKALEEIDYSISFLERLALDTNPKNLFSLKKKNRYFY